MSMKQRFQERLLVARDAAKFFRDNRRFRKDNPNFPTPPYALAFDAYRVTQWAIYARAGIEHAEMIADKVRKYRPGGELRADRPVILDWGCGPGRVVRQLANCLEPIESELHGTDYNAKTIRWCSRHLPDIRFEQNEIAPPLSFSDGQFDVIYGVSVFTHLSESGHFAWRDELARLLAPGGLLIITLHGDRFVKHLDPDMKARFLDGKLVVRESLEEGKREFQAFHPKSWVRANLIGPFECLEHDERDLFDWFYQDIWVLRKPEAGS